MTLPATTAPTAIGVIWTDAAVRQVPASVRQCPKCRHGFAREADMLLPLTRDRSVALKTVVGAVTSAGRLRPGWTTLYEVPTAYGVVDVLHVLPDVARATVRLRSGLGPVTDAAELRVVLRANAYPEGASIHDLAMAADLTISSVRRRVLPSLLERGQLVLRGDKFRTPQPYRMPSRSLVAIEAKRSSWRRALTQAGRYARFADASYVALDAMAMGTSAEAERYFEHHRVGLLSVSACVRAGCPASPGNLMVRLVRPAPATRPVAWERALVAERAWQLILDGEVSGPVYPVFGRDACASGADPRLANHE